MGPKTGECKSFCAQSLDSWSFKCSWDCCTGCPECASTTTETTRTTSTTATTTPTPVATTVTTSLAQPCKPWCADRDKLWENKCKWVMCKGCEECVPSGRRLSEYAEHLTRAFLV